MTPSHTYSRPESEGAPRPATSPYTRLKSEQPDAARSAAAISALIRGLSTIACLCLFVAALCVYGVRDGLIVSIFAGGFTGLAALLGLVPAIGPLLYWVVARLWLVPIILGWFPGIHPSWVTTGYLVLGLVLSSLFTIGTSMIAVARRI